MSLKDRLQQANTEEDVKDAYIAALGLDSYSKNLIDIQTREIWFEAKDAPTPPIIMFAQLLFYVRAARKRGEAIPAFLCVIDREKAALMPTERALDLLADKSISWPKSGSGADKVLAAKIAPYVQAHIVEYEIDHDEDAFIAAVKDAIAQRKIIRTPITPTNLRQVFDRWVSMVGSELGVENEADYAVLFFADIMHDGEAEAMKRPAGARMLMTSTGPTFLLRGETYELASKRGYQNFWSIYDRPPKRSHRHQLLERRDSLLPLDEQKFKGAYFTPLNIVDRAYDELRATLGDDWQDKYLIWDMCAGVGNLEAKFSGDMRNVYMSTLDQADVTIMEGDRRFAGAGGVAPGGCGVGVYQFAIGGQHQQVGRAGQFVDPETARNVQVVAVALLRHPDIDVNAFVFLIDQRADPIAFEPSGQRAAVVAPVRAHYQQHALAV